MKLLKISTAALCAFVAVFLVAAFIHWEINPAEWSMFARSHAAVVGVVFAGIAAAMTAGVP